MYLFITYIEDEEEETDSLVKLKETLQSEVAHKDISNHSIEQIINFIVQGFEGQLYRLSHNVYKWTWFGWLGDNCFMESSNLLLARDHIAKNQSTKFIKPRAVLFNTLIKKISCMQGHLSTLTQRSKKTSTRRI